MKEKLLKLSKPFLATCMALGLWFTCDGVSIVFFGEYEPPIPEKYM